MAQTAPAGLVLTTKTVTVDSAAFSLAKALLSNGVKPDGDAFTLIKAYNPLLLQFKDLPKGSTLVIPAVSSPPPLLLAEINLFPRERDSLQALAEVLLESVASLNVALDLKGDTNDIQSFKAALVQLQDSLILLTGDSNKPGLLLDKSMPVVEATLQLTEERFTTTESDLKRVEDARMVLPTDVLTVRQDLFAIQDCTKAFDGANKGDPTDSKPPPRSAYVRLPVMKESSKSTDPEVDGYFVFWEGQLKYARDGGRGGHQLGRSRGVEDHLPIADLYVWASQDASGSPQQNAHVVKVRQQPKGKPQRAVIYVH